MTYSKYLGWTILLTYALSLCSGHVVAAGLMKPKHASLNALDIKEHHVQVMISDGYAITSVEQIFHNPNTMDLEAIYSFPIPEKAAVSEFTYWIDDKRITGEVLKKESARRIYEEEKNAGREAAITEQHSFRTFDISVFPVRSHDDIRIKLTYIQPTHVDTGIGRYAYPLEEGGTDEEKLAFWDYKSVVKEKFSFDLQYRSSYPVDVFRLPKHPNANIKKVSETEWRVTLTEDKSASIVEENDGRIQNTKDAYQLKEDIVVYWRHKEDLPGTVDLITHQDQGKTKGTFMMTVTPGDDLTHITEGRDWVFVLDYSGSMEGKYQSMIEGVNKGIAKLNSNDRFRIFTFSSHAKEVTTGYVSATRENVIRMTRELESLRPNGSTNLYNGLEMGTAALDSDRSSAIILVTDGVANVGKTEKNAFLELMQANDVRLFTFVMGNSANRPLLHGMSKLSNGFAVNISNSDDIVGKIIEATGKLKYEALHDVEISFDGIRIRSMSPENIGSLYRGQQLIVMGQYWDDDEALKNDINVTISGKKSGQKISYSTEFRFPKHNNLHPELERIWAYASIEGLQAKMDYFGEDADTKQAITDIALEYGLVTNYTSMVIMREEAFAHHGIDRKNKQRVQQEHDARNVRRSLPVQNNRVDNNRPMYSNPAPTHSGGGGSMGLGIVLIMLVMLSARLTQRAR